MNMKSLFIGLAFILVCLASCSEEHLSDKSLSGEVSLSLSLDPLTKGSTEPLTEKEKQINRCLVSIFKYNNQTVGDLIKTYTEDFSSPASGSYLVENLVVPMDEQVYILVVANYPEFVKEYNSYADFQGLTSGKAIPSYSNPEDFNESDLIKVGGMPFTFTAANREATVNLKQLAAKIRIRLTMEEKVNSVTDAIEIGGVNVVDKINEEIAGGKGNPKVESLFPNLAEECGGNSHGFGFGSTESHTVNGKPAHSGSKWIVMECDSVRTKKVTTWSVGGLTIKINNIVLNSPLIIENEYAGKQVGSLENLQMSNPFVNGTWDYIFYTYQREWLVKDEEKVKGITVEISGTMKDVAVTYKQSRSGTLHAGWSGPNGIEEQKGWGGGTHFVAADGNDFGDNPWSVFKQDGDPVQGTLSTSQIFRAVINPSQSSSSTAGLLQGNYYDVTGTLKIDPKAEAEITWVVVGIDNVLVDVPSFD